MVERISRVVIARIHDDKDEQGFTLIELLIVIVVLGILAAVTVFGLSGSASQSAVSACKADARTVELAIDAWHANNVNGAWPAAWVDLTTGTAPYLRAQPSSTHYQILPQWGTSVVDVVPAGTGVVGLASFDNTPPAPNVCESVK